MNNKKKVIILAIIILILLGTLIIFKINESNSNATSGNKYQKVISVGEKVNGVKDYIGIYNNELYFTDGYSISELFVLQGEEENIITEEIISEAKKYLKENKRTFIYNNKKYFIENLFDALYMQNNSVAVFMEDIEAIYGEVVKESINEKIEINELKKNKNEKYKKMVDSSISGDIYLKNIDLEYNSESINSDYIIQNIIKDKKMLFEDDPLSEELISTQAYEFDENDYLIIEKKKNDYKVDYYVYIEEQNSFRDRLGF